MPRTAALLICIVTLLPALPTSVADPGPVPGTNTPPVTAPGTFARQGEVETLANGHSTRFLSGNEAFEITVPVYNAGPQPVTVPVFAWLHNDDNGHLFHPTDAYPTDSNTEVGWCFWVTVGPVHAQPGGGGVNVPNMSVARSGAQVLRTDIPKAGLNLTIRVNPDSVSDLAPKVTFSGHSSLDNSACAPLTSGESRTRQGGEVNGYIIKDLRPDYQIFSANWCQGQPGNPTEAVASESSRTCTPAIASLNDISFAHTYSSHDPSQGLDPHPSYFELTYAVTPTAASPWVSLIDYGGPCGGIFTGSNPSAPCAKQYHNQDTFLFNTSALLFGNTTGSPGVDISNNWTRETAGNAQNRFNSSYIHPFLDTISGVTVVKQRVGSLDLMDLYNNYTVNFTLDRDDALRQVNRANDGKSTVVTIASTDFVGNFTLSSLKTNKNDPYTTSIVDLDKGTFSVRNIGLYTRTTNVSWWLDDHTPCAANLTLTLPRFDGNWNNPDVVHSLTTPNNDCKNMQTTNPNQPKYLSPGSHHLTLRVDLDPLVPSGGPQNYTTEPNETNNVDIITIFVKDANAPTFPAPTVLRNSWSSFASPTIITSARPHENLFVRQIIKDEAQDDINATANFTLNGHPEISRTYHLPPGVLMDGNNQAYEINITDFGFATNATEENWTLHIDASDAFHNEANSTPTLPLHLVKWPIQTMNAEQIWNHTEENTPPTRWTTKDNQSFAYGTNTAIDGWIDNLWPENTGIPDQANVTYNLNVTFYPANPTEGNQSFNGTYFTPQFTCAASSAQDPVPPNPVTGPAKTPCTDPAHPASGTPSAGSSQYGVFRVGPIVKTWGSPGQWNASVKIKDLGGEERVINRTFRFNDSPPDIKTSELFDLNDKSITSANAGDPLHIHIIATDDAVRQNGAGPTAYLNFTRPSDNAFAGNVTVGNRSADPNTADGLFQFHWDYDITTGRAGMMGVGGALNVVLAIADENGNWVSRKIADNFTINDTQPPTLLNFTVDPSTQQTRGDILFTFRATDETNVTGLLTISKLGTVVQGPIKLVADPETPDSTTGHYSAFHYVTNFTDEGQYDWEFKAVDSLGRPSANAFKGGLNIKDNLGPRFEIHSPSLVINTTRYGQAAPRIEILTFDPDLVDESSIRLTIDDEPIPCQHAATTGCSTSPSPAGSIPGIIISYQWPVGRAFNHGDIVTVNVTAVDNSDLKLSSSLPFTFTVDASPPTVKLVSFEPHYPSFDAHPWNVSLATKFVLSADDPLNGGPSTCSSDGDHKCVIKFSVLGNNAENTYSAPFTLDKLPNNVYTGPRTYQISYWAEDGVGNTNKGKANTTITVFVDDSAPSLTREIFPQGRYINASFSDGPPGPGAVGVQRVVLWFRTNDQAWNSISMSPPVITNGEWTGVLPEGRKGDKIAWYVQAFDNLGNAESVGNETSPQGFYSVDNHPPVLKLTTPSVGEKINRALDIKWTASDADNDPLVFGVYLCLPGCKQQFTEIAKLESPDIRHYLIDSSKYQDGDYTVRVTASDGQFVQISEASVSFQNRASAIGPVQTGSKETQPGQKVLITAQITKAQAQVEAHLYVDGQLVGSYPMNDEGKDGDAAAADGTYSALVPVDAPGDYSVEIFTQYSEDGQIQTARAPDAATFSATLTPGYVMNAYGAQLILVGVLAIAAVGVAVFFIARRR